MNDLQITLYRLYNELPGWWYRIGECNVSCDATIGQNNNDIDSELLKIKLFDDGFECDIRQPSTVAEALNGAIELALEAKRNFK